MYGFCQKNKIFISTPICKSVETFISPILSSPSELLDGTKLADGWRCFKNLRVIQKKKII